MTVMFQPSVVNQPELLKSTKFVIQTQLTKDDLARIEPLWNMSLSKSAETPNLGKINFRLTQDVTSFSGSVSLKIKAESHIFDVIFSSGNWLETLSQTFDEGFHLADHVEISALALEAQFLAALTSIEQYLGTSLSFLELSAIPFDQQQEHFPGAHFEMESETWGVTELSIIPTSSDANTMLIKLLAHYADKPTDKEDSHGAITLNGSLVANAVEITHEQLQKLRHGDGFMLNKNWVETSELNLVVANKSIATVNRNGTTFEVGEVFVKQTTKKEAAPTQKARAARRQRRERKA